MKFIWRFKGGLHVYSNHLYDNNVNIIKEFEYLGNYSYHKYPDDEFIKLENGTIIRNFLIINLENII